jgi:uncharacterized DUF497 family protein
LASIPSTSGSIEILIDEAKTVFLDRFALESLDVDHSSDEDRFAMIGRSDQERILVIAYTVRDRKTIRIISARLARPQERFQYEK